MSKEDVYGEDVVGGVMGLIAFVCCISFAFWFISLEVSTNNNLAECYGSKTPGEECEIFIAILKSGEKIECISTNLTWYNAHQVSNGKPICGGIESRIYTGRKAFYSQGKVYVR
jgi:hypothetical protein